MNGFGFRAAVRLMLVAALFAVVPVASGAEIPGGHPALSRLIDQEIGAKSAPRKLGADGQADDAAFLRRLYLDLHGTLPPADKPAAFLDSKDPDKRAKLIEELLADERYGRHLSDVWYGLLIPLFPTNKTKVEVERLSPWLTKQFNENRPWDRLVHDMLTASGPTINDNPGMIPFLNGNTVMKPEEITDLVSGVFLGANLKCAQCHNHPFAAWTKKDYWGAAAFFTRIRREGTGNSNIRGVVDGAPKKLDLPEWADKGPPRFLGGEEAKVDRNGAYRPAFAEWATSPKNPFFARAMVNRTWAHFFGRGLVSPIDDVRPENKSTHPELFQKLTDGFIASGFDLKNLARAVCNSQAYQRTSRPDPGDRDAEKFYAQMPVRVLTPLQLANALSSLSVVKFTAKKPAREFLQAFSIPGEEPDPLHYDRGIPPQLRLANSPVLERGRQELAVSLASSATTPSAFVEQAYLRILSRRPTEEERRMMTAHVEKAGAPRAHDDVVWVLLNSSEFTLVR